MGCLIFGPEAEMASQLCLDHIDQNDGDNRANDGRRRQDHGNQHWQFNVAKEARASWSGNLGVGW